MDENLTKQDLDVILESLTFSRDQVREAANAPTYEAKMDRVKRYEDVLVKVRKLKVNWID